MSKLQDHERVRSSGEESLEQESEYSDSASKQLENSSRSLSRSSIRSVSNSKTDFNEVERSPYLVKRLLESEEKNLFSHVKFNLVKKRVESLNKDKPKILDVGCGLQVAKRYLGDLGLSFDYVGVDYESKFSPDFVVDLNYALDLTATLPWEPDVVLVLDVLEHLHEDKAKLDNVVANLAASLPSHCTAIITLPQMYRLDRFKPRHLHYPEHKIRLTQREWRDILSNHFDVTHTQGVGYLSVIPYLVMASRRYKPDNRLGRLFNYLRGNLFEFGPLKPVDLMLSNTLGKIGPLKHVSNDILFVANPKR